MHHLGATRSSLKADHLLQTPDTFIRTPLPGASNVEFVVHVSPQLGARFTQMTAEFAAGGTLGPAPAQRFLYVIEGELELTTGGRKHMLAAGGFVYLPHGAAHTVRSLEKARVAVIEKCYEAEPGGAVAEIVVGNEASVAPVALMGDESLCVPGALLSLSFSQRMPAPIFIDEVFRRPLSERTEPLRAIRGHPDKVACLDWIPRVAKLVDPPAFKHQ